MATRKKSSTKSTFDIRKFRSEIAILKRKGLISKDYDARKVTPTDYLKRQVREFKDVIEGRATAVTVKSKETREAYKASGYKTKSKKVVVPVTPGEKVTVTHGRIVHKRRLGMGQVEIVEIPVPYHDLEQYLNDLAKQPNSKYKNEDERFGFKFHGNNSYGTFRTLQMLIDVFTHYKAIQDNPDPTQQEEIYQNFRIYRITTPKDWKPTEHEKPKREYRQRYSPTRVANQARTYRINKKNPKWVAERQAKQREYWAKKQAKKKGK